jgi:hypothetical protein
MESIDKKTDVKAHTVKEQYRHRLTKGYEYYRVRLHSARKLATSTNVDAVFNIAQVFPNHRADLLNGEWEVFLESFTADFINVDKPSLTVQMPDLITSPNDYVVGANGCQRSNILAVVPSTWAVYETVAAGNATTYKMLPYSYTSLVDRDSVGVKVDPTVLFQQGQLRVVLTDHQFGAIAIGAGAGQVAGAEHWQASVLFVHRSS